jgi:hypothetical protein
MKKTILLTAITFTALISFGQSVSMDFTRTSCDSTEHNLYQELNEGKVVVLEYIMLGCSSCILATDQITRLIGPFETAHPGRVKQYLFGFIKNYSCDQLDAWQAENHLGGTLFEDGSSQVGYYGGMGMPTAVVTATNNHTVLYKKLGFEPSDTTQIQAAIQAGLQYNPQGIGDNPDARKVRIYPSYFTTALNIELPAQLSGTVHLYDLTGNEAVMMSFSNMDRISMDGLDLKPGLYFVMVRSADGILGTGKAIRK